MRRRPLLAIERSDIEGKHNLNLIYRFPAWECSDDSSVRRGISDQVSRSGHESSEWSQAPYKDGRAMTAKPVARVDQLWPSMDEALFESISFVGINFSAAI